MRVSKRRQKLFTPGKVRGARQAPLCSSSFFLQFPFLFQHLLYPLMQVRNLIVNDIPNNIVVNPEVVMDEAIPHPCY
jgi:hypothetical protein